MVPRTIPGDITGLFPARQSARHGRLLAGRTVETSGDSLLSMDIASRPGGDIPGEGDQPTHGRTLVSPLHPRRASRGRGGAAGPGHKKMTSKPRELWDVKAMPKV